jgi:uncharacterized membrane protein
MRYVLGIIGLLALVASLGSCVMAKSSIHEIQGLIFLIVGALGLGLAAIVGELEAIHKTAKEAVSERLK